MILQEIIDKRLSYQELIQSQSNIKLISPKLLNEFIQDLQDLQDFLDKLDIKDV